MANRQQQHSSDHQFEIHVHAVPEYLCVVRLAVRKAAEIAGLAASDLDAVTLALEEALTNVIQHSYDGPCHKPILIKLDTVDTDDKGGMGLQIIVRDFGGQVDPSKIRSRDLEDVRPGGLGVHIIRSVMDEVEYSCPADGGMQLRMTKYFCPTAGSSSSRVDAVRG